MEITDLLIFTQKNKASDLHLSTGNPPILRIHGEMMPYKTGPLSTDDVKQMLFSIMTEQQRSDYERDLEIDSRFRSARICAFASTPSTP